RLGPFSVQSGTAADDRPGAARARQPARRCARPSNGADDFEAAAVCDRRRGRCRCRRAPRRRTRNQLPGAPARSERRPREARARSQRPARHLERRALAQGLSAPSLGRARRPPRLAAARGRAQHAALRRIPRRSQAPPESGRMKLPMLSADDKLAEIRRLYFQATKQTIQDDLTKALDLLKSMDSEDERERATV